MTSIEDHVWGERTRAIHAGGRPDPTTGARQVPIYQTTSFVFEDVEDAADLFALQKYGNIYSRLGNPTVAAFDELNPELLMPAHCTGWKAVHRLARQFPDAFVQSAVGTTVSL